MLAIRYWTEQEDALLKRRMIGGLACGDTIASIAEELSSELGRSVDMVKLRWRRITTPLERSRYRNHGVKRVAWSTKFSVDTMRLLDSIVARTGDTKTGVVTAAIECYAKSIGLG